MTLSATRSSTFTISDARYVASKLGADLYNLNARYGKPALAVIDGYVEETAQYLKSGYLESVDFGFKDGDRWILRLRYRAVGGGSLRDEVPGSLPKAEDVSEYPFYSYLTQNSSFFALSLTERAAFRRDLPVARTEGLEPTAKAGLNGNAAEYSRNGSGVSREVYRAV